MTTPEEQARNVHRAALRAIAYTAGLSLEELQSGANNADVRKLLHALCVEVVALRAELKKVRETAQSAAAREYPTGLTWSGGR